MIHGMKIYPQFFEDVITGKKNFEIRKNDRSFQVGDLLALNEYDGQHYTGKSCLVYVDYIMDEPEYVKKDMVVMAIKPCSVYRHEEPFSYNSMRKDYSVPLATTGTKTKEKRIEERF